MKILKTYFSGLLLIIAISYSIDLHSISHTFDNDHPDDSNHCELCIINHQKDQHYFVLQPFFYEFDLIPFISQEEINSVFVSTQISIRSTYFLGQFFNRPPPFTV